jgi:hypothetical protein
MECTLLKTDFKGELAGGAFLDDDWKCRVCDKLAGQHPAGTGRYVIPISLIH